MVMMNVHAKSTTAFAAPIDEFVGTHTTVNVSCHASVPDRVRYRRRWARRIRLGSPARRKSSASTATCSVSLWSIMRE